MAGFMDLPLELIRSIISELPSKHRLNVKHTCKTFHEIIPDYVYSLYKLENKIGSISLSHTRRAEEIQRAENSSIYKGFVETWREGFDTPIHRTKGIMFLTSLPGIPRQFAQYIDGVTDGYGAPAIMTQKLTAKKARGSPWCYARKSDLD